MKNTLRKMIVPATVSLMLVAPFVILEAVNTAGFATYGFPAALFGLMWFTAFVFVVLLTSIIQGLRAKNGMTLHPASIVLRAMCMVLIAVMWGGLLNDQMPCFMGVPNCD